MINKKEIQQLRNEGMADLADNIESLLDIIQSLINAARPIIIKPTITSDESNLYDAIIEAKRLIE